MKDGSLRWKRRLALALSILFALGVGEIYMRIKVGRRDVALRPGAIHVASDNPRLVYEHRPSAAVKFPGSERVMRTNAAGFRDDEFATAKPEGTYRVVVLGDSVTIGWNVARNDIFTDLLEKQLHAGGRKVEVFNMAVSGYNAMQEVEMLKARGLRYAPDLVIVGYVLNDNMVIGEGGLSRYFRHGFSYILDRIGVWARRTARAIGTSVTEEALQNLAVITAREKLPVLVVVFPRLDDDQDYAHQDRHDQIEALCSKHGFAHLDLLPVYRSAGFSRIRTGEDTLHPNKRGHQIASDAIRERLRAAAKRFGLD